MPRFLHSLLRCLFILIHIRSLNGEQQCQPITYYECKNIGYNQTSLPNKFNHQDQKDVALVVSIQFIRLLPIESRLTIVISYPENYPCHLTLRWK